MILELGNLVPSLGGWTLCIDEEPCDCSICVHLPSWARNMSEVERTLLALYLASKYLLDYRLAAAMHLYMITNRVALRPELFVRGRREAKVVARVPKAKEHYSPDAWEAALYRGIIYAQQIRAARNSKVQIS